MPRPIVVVAALATALLVAPVASAQEASPAATPEAMTGVLVEPLGSLDVGPGVFVPVLRVELAPGAALPPHLSPGPAVAQVESGQVNFVAITGAASRAQLIRLPVAATPGVGTPASGTPQANGTPAADMVGAVAVVDEELILVGDEIALGTGEGVAFGPDVVHTFRNSGSEPAVLLIAGVFPPNQPPFQFSEVGATPVATPGS